ANQSWPNCGQPHSKIRGASCAARGLKQTRDSSGCRRCRVVQQIGEKGVVKQAVSTADDGLAIAEDFKKIRAVGKTESRSEIVAVFADFQRTKGCGGKLSHRI